MRWATRSGPHVDRTACAWLVARFIDADAEAGSRDRAVLVIAHALAGLEAFDEIVVADGGRIVERGTHAELLRRSGRYARMALAQEAALAA